MPVEFKLEKVLNEDTGTEKLSLVKYTPVSSGAATNTEREVWFAIEDIDRLFDTCVKRWKDNWDLDKVCVAISESQID